jgi:hypothetical protein
LLRIDATPETNKKVGQTRESLPKNGNLIPRVRMFEGKPRILFTASKAIKSCEQLCYENGDLDRESVRQYEWLLASKLKKKQKQ